MKTTIETITPAQAAKWLEPHINRDNRTLRQKHVEFLAQQILAGKWQTTHQGVAFAKDGRLLDGHHRLAAIVLAGKAVQLQVSTGMDADAFQVVDCGLKRQHFERIHLVDDPKHNRFICTVVATYLRSVERHNSFPVSQIEDTFLTGNGKMADSWMWLAREWCGKVGVPRAPILASLAVYHFTKPQGAAEFSEGLRSGANLAPGSPILALQRSLIHNAQRVDYWVAQAAMRQHLNGKTYLASSNGARLYAASEDMIGNKNSIRVLREREEKGKKAAETRRANAKAR